MDMDSNAVEMPDIGLVNDATGDGGVDNITQPHPTMSNHTMQQQQQQQQLAPVPDVLLSLAKDNRYISEIVSLLSQVLVPYASIFLLPTSSGRNDNRNRQRSSPTNNNTTDNNIDDILEDDGQRFIDRIRPELNLIASIIVHSATFIYYTRNFREDINSKANNSKRNSRNESIQRSLGMESLNLAYRYPENGNHGMDSSTTDVYAKKDNNSTNNIIQTRIKKYLMSIIPVLRVNQWHRLLILQTLVPYIIQRVGRGGWSKDLGGIISSIMHQIVVALGIVRQPQITSINNRSDNELRQEDQEDMVLLNNDRLRGAARRRLFNEQRQRMMSSSSSLGSNNLENSTSMNEARNSIDNSQTVSLQTNNTTFERKLKKLSSLSWNVIKKISLAMSSLNHGAHSLPTTHNSNNTSENLDRYAKMIKWFLKLHLAMFYWNGMYPTIAHRLARVKLRDGVAPYSSPLGSSSSYSPMSGAIVANRPTYKPIAVMILFQAFAALAQTTAEASIEVAHSIQVSFFRWRRRRRRLQSQQYPQSNRRSLLEHNSTNSERAEYLDLIEERVPGIESAKCCSTTNKKKKKKGRQGTETSDIIHPCGVCLNERVNPAAPLGCGHVFCWNCILHWVSNVRAECPLCRAPTKPPNIIPLYNYP